MNYFWTHKEKIPEGLGYGQFTPKHFAWLAVMVLFVAVYTICYAHAGMPEKIFILRATAAVLIAIDVIKLALIARQGIDVVEYLPLELCSFAAYFIVCDSIWIGNTIFPSMLVTLFMPAAIMAVFFPTTTPLPAVNFYTIHQFLYHGLIIAYVIARFACGEIPMTYAGVWPTIFRVICLGAVIYVVDTILDRNFMFLRKTENNPLLETIWKAAGGGFAYTGGLICFCILVIHVFFALFKIIAFLFIH